MNTLEFGNLDALKWVWLTAAFAVLAWYGLTRHRQAAAALAEGHLQPFVVPGFRAHWPALRMVAGALAFALLVGALTDPRLGTRDASVQRSTADVVLVLDTSRSMLAEDATPNRLAREKQFAIDAVDRLSGDRVGLVDFAGVATLRCPLTLNYGAVKSQINELAVKASRQGGSDLSTALLIAARSFPEVREGGRAIVVISDGEDLARADGGANPVDIAAQIWQEHGIRIVTVGLGDEASGARIPTGGGRFLVHDGQEVWTRMDGSLLKDVALAADGSYIPAGTAQVDLGALLSELLADLERVDRGVSTVQYAEPRFQWPAALALFFLLLQAVMPRSGRKETWS